MSTLTATCALAPSNTAATDTLATAIIIATATFFYLGAASSRRVHEECDGAVTLARIVDVAGVLSAEAPELDGGGPLGAAGALGSVAVLGNEAFAGLNIRIRHHGLGLEETAAVVVVVGGTLAHTGPGLAGRLGVPAEVHKVLVPVVINVIEGIRVTVK